MHPTTNRSQERQFQDLVKREHEEESIAICSFVVLEPASQIYSTHQSICQTNAKQRKENLYKHNGINDR